jgi:O-antigen/teichoic acid export membrane protein
MVSWESAASSIYVSYVAVGLISIAYLRQYITLRFDRAWSRQIITYVRFLIPGAVAGQCIGIDRILINVFSSAAAVGIYNAASLLSSTLRSCGSCCADKAGTAQVQFFSYLS